MKWPTIFGTIIQFHTHTPFPDFALTEISMVCGKPVTLTDSKP